MHKIDSFRNSLGDGSATASESGEYSTSKTHASAAPPSIVPLIATFLLGPWNRREHKADPDDEWE